MNTLKSMTLSLKTPESADPIAGEILKNNENNLGFIPNLFAGMANNTALLE
jgi:hypothetical protein